MTTEQYERLTTKSHVKKNIEPSDPNQEYFENGGAVLRWPEVNQRRAFSPPRRQEGSPRSPEGEGEGNLFDGQLGGTDRMKGSHRPRSAPLGKTPTKNLFKKTGAGTFFNDLLEAPEATAVSKYTTPGQDPLLGTELDAAPKRGHSSSRGRQAKRSRSPQRRMSPRQRGASRSASPGPNEEGDVEDAGIVEYGDDAYVIEDEEEAIHRIQAAMINAVVRDASPSRGRKRTLKEDEDFRKIGDNLFVSGKIRFYCELCAVFSIRIAAFDAATTVLSFNWSVLN